MLPEHLVSTNVSLLSAEQVDLPNIIKNDLPASIMNNLNLPMFLSARNTLNTMKINNSVILSTVVLVFIVFIMCGGMLLVYEWVTRKKSTIIPLLCCDSFDGCPYIVRIATGHRCFSSASSANIRLKLCGQTGESQSYHLYRSDEFKASRRKPFQQGATDNFFFYTQESLENIAYIQISIESLKKKYEKWYVRYVVVTDINKEKDWLFSCNCWFVGHKNEPEIYILYRNKAHICSVFWSNWLQLLRDTHLWWSLAERWHMVSAVSYSASWALCFTTLATSMLSACLAILFTTPPLLHIDGTNQSIEAIDTHSQLNDVFGKRTALLSLLFTFISLIISGSLEFLLHQVRSGNQNLSETKYEAIPLHVITNNPEPKPYLPDDQSYLNDQDYTQLTPSNGKTRHENKIPSSNKTSKKVFKRFKPGTIQHFTQDDSSIFLPSSMYTANGIYDDYTNMQPHKTPGFKKTVGKRQNFPPTSSPRIPIASNKGNENDSLEDQDLSMAVDPEKQDLWLSRIRSMLHDDEITFNDLDENNPNNITLTYPKNGEEPHYLSPIKATTQNSPTSARIKKFPLTAKPNEKKSNPPTERNAAKHIHIKEMALGKIKDVYEDNNTTMGSLNLKNEHVHHSPIIHKSPVGVSLSPKVGPRIEKTFEALMRSVTRDPNYSINKSNSEELSSINMQQNSYEQHTLSKTSLEELLSSNANAAKKKTPNKETELKKFAENFVNNYVYSGLESSKEQLENVNVNNSLLKDAENKTYFFIQKKTEEQISIEEPEVTDDEKLGSVSLRPVERKLSDVFRATSTKASKDRLYQERIKPSVNKFKWIAELFKNFMSKGAHVLDDDDEQKSNTVQSITSQASSDYLEFGQNTQHINTDDHQQFYTMSKNFEIINLSQSEHLSPTSLELIAKKSLEHILSQKNLKEIRRNIGETIDLEIRKFSRVMTSLISNVMKQNTSNTNSTNKQQLSACVALTVQHEISHIRNTRRHLTWVALGSEYVDTITANALLKLQVELAMAIKQNHSRTQGLIKSSDSNTVHEAAVQWFSDCIIATQRLNNKLKESEQQSSSQSSKVLQENSDVGMSRRCTVLEQAISASALVRQIIADALQEMLAQLREVCSELDDMKSEPCLLAGLGKVLLEQNSSSTFMSPHHHLHIIDAISAELAAYLLKNSMYPSARRITALLKEFDKLSYQNEDKLILKLLLKNGFTHSHIKKLKIGKKQIIKELLDLLYAFKQTENLQAINDPFHSLSVDSNIKNKDINQKELINEQEQKETVNNKSNNNPLISGHLTENPQKRTHPNHISRWDSQQESWLLHLEQELNGETYKCLPPIAAPIITTFATLIIFCCMLVTVVIGIGMTPIQGAQWLALFALNFIQHALILEPIKLLFVSFYITFLQKRLL